MRIYILILLFFNAFMISCEKKVFTPEKKYKPKGDYLAETLKKTDEIFNKIEQEKNANSNTESENNTTDISSDIKKPTVNEILIKRALKLKKEGKYNRALNIFLDLLKEDTKNISILKNVSELFALLNNFKQSERYAQKILKLDEKNIFALTMIGNFYAKNGEINKAIKTYMDLVEISPNYTLYHNLGVLYEKQNKLKKAFEYYKKAIRLKKSESAYYSLALLAKKLNDSNNVIKYLKKAVKTGDSIKIKKFLAKEYMELKKYAKAELLYAKIASKTNSLYDFNALASVYLLEQKYTKAEKTYLKALRIEPNNKNVLYNLSLCYYRMKNPQKMKKIIRNYEKSGASVVKVRELKVYLSKISGQISK